LPSDSTFAVAMINQRQAAKEEQQRIKNLVLNLDLRENEDTDGEDLLTPDERILNIHRVSAGHEKPPSHHHHNRPDNRSGKERGQRVRKLQLSDVDWYDNPGRRSLPEREQAPRVSQGHLIDAGHNHRRRRNIWAPAARLVVHPKGET
jgi:regulator of nonsense transcripts 2